MIYFKKAEDLFDEYEDFLWGYSNSGVMALTQEYSNRSIEYLESPEPDIWLWHTDTWFFKNTGLWSIEKKVVFSIMMLEQLDS